MSGFTLFKRGECPICGGASKGCRQSTVTDLIFCRDTTANPTNYIHRGEDVHSFGMWQHTEDATAFNEQASEERQRRRREFLEAESRRRQRQIARQLPAVERHRYSEKLLQELPLIDADRENLLQRGFTLEQIASGGYRSVSKFQKVGTGYPANLPGIIKSGFGGGQILNIGGDGILCPIRSQDGLIIGFQVRLHDAVDGRYRWLSSATKKNPDGATPHLNGELPLGLFEPDHFESDSIWMTEGTAIKPSLTRYRLGVPVVGAASGRFSASPEAAKAAVEYLCTKYETRVLTFAVDAGDVINRSGVPERWQDQFKFYQSLGYQCRVAWWGQVAKDSDDVDELADISLINYITPDEFRGIVEEHRTEKPTTKVSIESEGLSSDWAWQQWLRSRKFTPDIKSNEEKFRFPKIPDSDVIVAAKSGLGTGKTEAELELIKACNRGSCILGYRNNLLFQTIERASEIELTIYHLREDDGHALVADSSTHQALCLDSIHHIDGYFADRDIYLDETVSVLIHACNGGTLGEHQARAIKILTHALQVCNRVILLDANLSDLYVDFIAKLAPKKRVIKIENQRKIPPHNIKFIEGVDIEDEVKKRDKSALINVLCSDNVIPWISSDSKELTKVIDKLLKQSGKTGFVLNGDTASEPWAKEFLAKPNKFIQDKKPGYFIISPTAESGISVTIKNYFTDKFSFLTGVLGTNSQHQIMVRLRDNSIPHHVFCPERSMVRDRSKPQNYSVNAFKRVLEDRISQSAMLASIGSDNPDRVNEVIANAISRNNDDWLSFSYTLGALDNFEMDNLRKCLIHALEEAGHNVEIIKWDVNEEFKIKEKIAKEAVQEEYAKELDLAIEYDSVEEAKKIARSNPRKEIQRRIEKTFLIERLPGIKESGIFNANFILDYHIKDQNFIAKQQRYWLLHNLDVSQKRHEVDWYYKAIKEDFFSASMRGTSHLTIWALKELGILGLLDKPFHKDLPEVIEIVEKARTRDDIKLIPGMQPLPAKANGSERIAFITKLLGMIGLKKRLLGKPLINGVQVKCYEIDTASMQTPARLAVLAAVERKFTRWMEEKSQVDWSEAADVTPQQELLTQAQEMANSRATGIALQYGFSANSQAVSTQEKEDTEQWWDKVKKYTFLVVEKLSDGVTAVKEVLNGLSSEEKWGAITGFDHLTPEHFEQFTLLMPDWVDFCNH